MAKENKRYIIAIDLGTTSIRTIAYDTENNNFFGVVQKKLNQYYPKTSWVEQDPRQILDIVDSCLKETTKDLSADSIYGIGMTNQRETFVAWRKSTGEPLYNAIVWQCRRTQELCQEILNNRKLANKIHRKTGLFVDSYFSATKMNWLIKNNREVRQALVNEDLCFGTMDSFVIYHLTAGKVFVTDHSNASRTLLYNLHTQDWDYELMEYFGIPRHSLPRIVNSDEYVGDTIIDGKLIKIGGILGDQQSSLFGQACTKAGEVKTTFGTGGFMLCNIGEKPILSTKLLTTVAWKTREGISYAYEGNMYSAGACINWLQDTLGIIKSPADTEVLANSVENSNGVQFIPALSGLGAPFWKSGATAQFCGLTLGSSTAHMVRAVLRSIAYQARAVYDCMSQNVELRHPMRIDGGMTKNNTFMQFLSDILHAPIARSQEAESTSLGACYMCGLAFGAYKSLRDIHKLYKTNQTYSPTPRDYDRETHYKEWLKLVDKL